MLYLFILCASFINNRKLNMKNKSLVVLAAGMGSRYGGLKQMDTFGPNGETIIDYSIYDAIKAGFTKVIFIVRESFLGDFKSVFDKKFSNKIELEYVTQELNQVPEGSNVHPERQKPWGTMHAVLAAKEKIQEPFCVINADDYYGKDAFKIAADFFDDNESDNNYAIISYLLENTLSKHGTVNRGICIGDDDGNLLDIKECTKIGYQEDGSIAYPEGDDLIPLQADDLVSMNLFAFYPSIIGYSEKLFEEFIAERGMELKSEFFIPTALDSMIKAEQVKVRLLQSTSNWFGVTYQEDKPIVIAKLNKLIEEGVYPSDLWD